MNFIHTRPASADLWDRYAHLRPGPKLILCVKSLICLPTSKSEFLDCLRRAGLRSPDGKAWAFHSVNDALNELLAQRLLNQDLSCISPLLHPASVDAVASTDGEAMVLAVRATFP